MGLTTTDECFEQLVKLDLTEPQDRKPLIEKDDPLALAWAAYRVWQKFPHRRWTSFEMLEAHDHDREMANSTRRYYRDKLAIKVLRGQELTAVQREIYDISNGSATWVDQLGLLYRLPYFYVEDIAKDGLTSTYRGRTPSPPTGRQAWRPAPLLEHQVQDLHPVTEILRTRRGSEIAEYWFRNSLDQPVLWSVATNNPLRELVCSLWRRDSITVRAYFHHGQLRGLDFWHWYLSQVELV